MNLPTSSSYASYLGVKHEKVKKCIYIQHSIVKIKEQNIIDGQDWNDSV